MLKYHASMPFKVGCFELCNEATHVMFITVVDLFAFSHGDREPEYSREGMSL